MDVKINGNLYVQNDYSTKQRDTVSAGDSTSRRAVLSRNAEAFKRAAACSYDKSLIYNSQGMEVVQEAEQTVAEETRSAGMMECVDTLKSLVTPEDYSQLEAWGLIPDEDNPEAFVSVYERIQIEMAAYCEDYDATGLNINKEKMKAVLGSESMANAVSKANDLSKTCGKLSDDAKKYIIENNLEPTLQNVYKAVHSGLTAGNAVIMDDKQWQQLAGQVEKFFETNGIENNCENIESAKWIISQNLPLNVDNFDKLTELNKVDFGSGEYMEKLSENISYTIYFGGDGLNTDVTGKAFDMDAVREAVETVQSAMDKDVDYILKNNRKLNIENLKQRIEERKKEKIHEEDNSGRKNKVLMEARAVLTAGSLFMMRKAGINITFTEITVLVDMSAGAENDLADALFMLDGEKPAEADRQLLTHTVNVMAGLSQLPVGVAGKIYSGQISYTAEAVYSEGNLMMARFRAASETYEAIGTQVRADLGDSISKAFRNIDDILTAEGIQVDEESRRAARVLGYNSMEITKEAVIAVGNIVGQLDELTKKLTPRAAVHLIRKGINPLGTNIEELNQQLTAINNELSTEDDHMKYSEYLWKLEKSGNISNEERGAYIQLYRIIEHINRQDGRVAGAVSGAGQELTLANLYSAVKTLRAKGVDKKVDDSLGLLESGYSRDDLTTYMENAAKLMEDKSIHSQYKYERMQQKLDTILKDGTLTEQELMRIVSGMEGVSVNNIYNAMLASDPHFYKMVTNLDDEKPGAELEKMSKLWQDDGDETPTEEQIVASYMNLKTAADAENREHTYERAVMRADIRQAVSFMAGQAENRSYYVPMEIGGDTTMVHMTFKQGGADGRGRISIYTETVEGKISAFMTKTEEGYSIFVATDNQELRNKLEPLVEGTVIHTENVREGMWSEMTETDNGGEDSTVTTYGELVRQARSFIHNVLRGI